MANMAVCEKKKKYFHITQLMSAYQCCSPEFIVTAPINMYYIKARETANSDMRVKHNILCAPQTYRVAVTQ